MVHTTESDDSKMGDIAALTNGLRFTKENTLITNFGNYQTNGSFKEFGANVSYTDKAGGGNIVKVVVRDDLNQLTIDYIKVILIGHSTIGE